MDIKTHPCDLEHAYLITNTSYFYHTSDGGMSWSARQAPLGPSTRYPVPALELHKSRADHLIWSGMDNCTFPSGCHITAYFSPDSGGSWEKLEEYVRLCALSNITLNSTEDQFMCESLRNKRGPLDNLLELVVGSPGTTAKQILMDDVVGFTTWYEPLLIVIKVRSPVRARARMNVLHRPSFYKYRLYRARYCLCRCRATRRPSRRACFLMMCAWTMYVVLAMLSSV